MIPDWLFILIAAFVCMTVGGVLTYLYIRFHILPNRYIRRRPIRQHYSFQPVEPGKI